MALTPRVNFLPPGVRRSAGLDRALQIGYGSTCSQPSTLATMLRLLDVRPGDHVLDVGSGSGWSTAILARLVGPAGRVFGVELEEELVKRSALALDSLVNVRIRLATPGRLGALADGPFNRILVSATTREVPQELVDQLTGDGAMVLPLSDRLVRVTREGREWASGHYAFVPLR